MNTREFKTNGHKFKFINASFSNSRSWGHISELYINDTFITKSKATYLNRTWEEYQYQSVMKSAIYDYISDKLDLFIDRHKEDNNIKRLSSVKREELVKEFKKSNKYLYSAIKKL